MIKRKIIWLLRSLRHDLRVKKFFFSFSHYVHYAMIKRKNIIFLVNIKINFAITFTAPGS